MNYLVCTGKPQELRQRVAPPMTPRRARRLQLFGRQRYYKIDIPCNKCPRPSFAQLPGPAHGVNGFRAAEEPGHRAAADEINKVRRERVR